MRTLNYEEIKCIVKKSGVYYLKFRNHNYIGSTLDLKQRLADHICRLKNGKHSNIQMQNIYNKYGEDVSFFSILEVFEHSDLLQIREAEKKWMDLLGPSLNIKPDPTTQENSQSQSKKVYQYSLDGKLLNEFPSASEAARQLNIASSMISACARGTINSARGYHWSYKLLDDYKYAVERSKWKWIPVKMINLENGNEMTFKNIADAAKFIDKGGGNVSSIAASISSILLGKGKTLSKKYTFIKV